MKEFFREIVSVFNYAPALMAIAVTIAVAFLDIFISKAQGFPYVIFYGESNAGKSTIVRFLAAIFGFGNSAKLTSGTSTMVALRAELENYNNIPVFIEELDKKRIDNIEDLGKDSFSATPRKKSSKDNKEIVTEINTTFCAATNHFFENMTFANFSRFIPVNLTTGQFDLTDFQYHHSSSKLEKLSCFLPELLSYRDKSFSIYEQEYKIAQKYCNHARICNNAAIGMAMWTVINTILDEKLVNTEVLAKDYLKYFEQYLDTETKYCDIFLADVYSLFNKEELIYGRDFVITKNKYLRINLKKYCDIYNSTHENTKLNPAQLRLKLNNDKRIISLVATDMKPIGKAIKIDISGNETLLNIKSRITKLEGNDNYED
ncbi:MAG: DUF927 domain-containing protein [Fusobacterium sp.]|nr:DUF927 domain-containing protein [Fusobacterium sp.]MCM1073878.1 DUF927 domain-containing protein [Bacteroides sp.]